MQYQYNNDALMRDFADYSILFHIPITDAMFRPNFWLLHVISSSSKIS